MAQRNLPHLDVSKRFEAEPFTTRKSGKTPQPPERNTSQHAGHLLRSLNAALAVVQEQTGIRTGIAQATEGFYLEFRLPPGSQEFAGNLEDRRRRIELMAVRQVDGFIVATVWVPITALNHFTAKIQAYRDKLVKSGTKPQNQALVSRIEDIQIAAVKSLYTEPDDTFPSEEEPHWWEIWIRRGQSESFLQAANALDLRVSETEIEFPEREIYLLRATVDSLGFLMVNSGAIAEIRRASDRPATFANIPNVEQAEYAQDLAQRLVVPGPGASAICIFDSGVAREHPILTPALAADDVLTYDPNWPGGDSAIWGQGHGTKMAGIALYGSLEDTLLSTGPLQLRHRLESVKILHPDGDQHDPLLYGAVTRESAFRAEVQNPDRRRIFCMAVTSRTNSGQGRPTSWSAAIDGLAFGEGDQRRLIILSAGNINGVGPNDYLARNDFESVHDPSQSWNAVTVGGFTERAALTDPTFAGWRAVAPVGDLSPTSSTSVSWERQWPVKPDVVFEAGNLATDGQVCDPAEDLCAISTYHQFNVRHFTHFGDTSAAAALAANFAARIQAEQPELWPETIRGLMIHSARWTEPMLNRLNGEATKTARLALVRRYGFGVPDLTSALLCATNDVTLRAEDEIIPFKKDKSVKTNVLNLHKFPWPKAQLEGLESNAQLRITLSYFIEPNPGQRGWIRKHRYSSHGLRFALKRAEESLTDFRARINRVVANEQDTGLVIQGDDQWFLGSGRDAGSIHSDYWNGTAAELAARDAIAIFPTSGWWKENPAHERYTKSVRYSLLVSLSTSVETDIYTPIRTMITAPIQI